MVTAKLFRARVMHRRFFPRSNTFSYGVYYLVLPLPVKPVPGRLAGFDPRDLGPRDGGDLEQWVRSCLAEHGLGDICRDIVLVTMPRILGYVFNPVSFYFGLDASQRVRAVLCEVHNTFGEQHSYLCMNPDHFPVAADQWLAAPKTFHVSPFLERDGHYRFRFDLSDEKLGVWIEYHDADGRKQLITSMTGRLVPLTAVSLRREFWRHPLVTLKVIALIHWQALKIVMKGIRYIKKPVPLKSKVTVTQHQNNAEGSSFTEKNPHLPT